MNAPAIKIAFLNGSFSEKLSDIALLPKEVTLQTEKLFLHIPKNYKVPFPIYVVFLNSKKNDFTSNMHMTILMDEKSEATFFEEHTAENADNYTANVFTEINLEKNARLTYYKLQNESLTATHLANVTVQQKQDSHATTFFVDNGGRLVKEALTVHLSERGAECYLNGLYLLSYNQQQVDNRIHVDHLVAHGKSSMIYKGILDKKSHAIFNGKVLVHPNAQQINAHQANHNLLLSTDAEVNTKPELEIYADDVKCTHGATVGQLDQDALFYLRSRGIEKNAALRLLTQAFVADMMTKIEQSAIQKHIREQVSHHEEL